MSIELKIKAKSLAAEAQIIKKEEQKLLTEKRIGSTNTLRRKIRSSPSLMALQPGTPEWKAEYVVLEKQILEKDSKFMAAMGDNYKQNLAWRKAKAEAGFTRLREHRINVVRPAARATHLARMILKGVPYRSVETRTDDKVKNMYGLKGSVVAMVQKYYRFSENGNNFTNFSQKEFDAWLDAPAVEQSEPMKQSA